MFYLIEWYMRTIGHFSHKKWTDAFTSKLLQWQQVKISVCGEGTYAGHRVVETDNVGVPLELVSLLIFLYTLVRVLFITHKFLG